MVITKGAIILKSVMYIYLCVNPYFLCRYYTKRPFVSDPRLLLLPPQFFREAVVLDVGCNEGWVTCEIGLILLDALYVLVT